MREIKFRAWCPERKMMCKVLSINFEKDTISVEFADGHGFTDKISSVVLMQFTGLLDKNGTPIYEGYIVYIEHPAWHEKCVVEFKDGSFIFRALDEPSKDTVIPGYTFMREIWKVKVIGNIHQNPELLKE
jgi:uncharacterized phage protein (TIGR01671 family)